LVNAFTIKLLTVKVTNEVIGQQRVLDDLNHMVVTVCQGNCQFFFCYRFMWSDHAAVTIPGRDYRANRRNHCSH
ncbi:hypothetical protein, partial [Photobacterium sp. OFAV2-7]|uniref:hypothetical protein n=1 Tax=Photobacterium sp. OFAV2-7 TaxID=2917748 RepID=UPI001EF5B8BA